LDKNGLGTILGNFFSQTHLVTLYANHQKNVSSDDSFRSVFVSAVGAEDRGFELSPGWQMFGCLADVFVYMD
jgi:hypothetical protein